jgi:hypothetical protein
MRLSKLGILFTVSCASVTFGACSPFDEGTAPDSGPPVSPPSDAVTDVVTMEDAVTSEDGPSAPHFSFFYTSLAAMRRLSGSQNGFGGDLRFGMPTGIEGADKICQTIATDEGFGSKTWKAFLSATRGPDGQVVHAIERIGEGPWYDRKGRLIARDRAGLLGADRPIGDPETVNDLPDETGEKTSLLGSTYDAVTGSNTSGRLYYPDAKNTCLDWTNNTLEAVLIMCGHAWLATGVANWIQAHPERSCVPGVNIMSNGTSDGSSIGAGGGWGGFYCFALTP